MTSSDETSDLSFTGEIDPDQYKPDASRTLSWGAIVLGVIVLLAVSVPALSIHVKKTALVTDIERRLQILASGRAEVLTTWLEGTARFADRVVESELFRLFATEMDLSGGDLTNLATPQQPGGDAGEQQAFSAPLVAQLPFMEQVLTDFTKSADFLASYLVDRKGVAYVTSAGADTLTPEQQALAKQVFTSGVLTYGPARTSTAGLVMDIHAPVFPVQSENGDEKPVGVMVLTAPVALILTEVLAPQPLSEPGERLRLLQMSGAEFIEIVPAESPPLKKIPAIESVTPGDAISFAQRNAIGGEDAVYSVGATVTGPVWWIVQELDVATAQKKLAGFVAASITVAVLAVLMVIVAFGAFWWRLSNSHNSALAEQFRRLAARIQAQKQLLDSINNTIADYIGLKSLDGTYRYVNPAFARAVGRDVDKVVGLDDAALLGEGTANRLKLSDQRVLASGDAVTISEEAYLGNKLHYLQISKVPFHGADEKPAGIVSVARDVTELVEEQKKKERAIQQTVIALVRAIELRDNYLSGHSKRVAGFAAAVAQRLNASPEEIATVEIAANLSQIGKLAISREILTKPERLTKKEIELVQQHVEHAASLLQDIDFELPVLDTIYQMHERLDGGGYPKGLKADEILLTAKILGACDVFCARVEPRSYRSGIPPMQALEILTDNNERYDPAVIAALQDVVESVAGEKLIAGIAAAG